MNTETLTVWDYLEQQQEDPYNPAKAAQALYEWGLNCLPNANPFLVYLDLIGWSKENYGADTVVRDLSYLGYMELDYLGDALKEYANDPRNVTDWINTLMQCEGV